MRSINFVILGSESLAAEFGRRGTHTDLALYDKKRQDVIRTWVVPTNFPEKIQGMIQAINMAEYAILHIDTLDRFAGEQIVALDMLGIRDGILSSTYDIDRTTLSAMIRGTTLERYTTVHSDDVSSVMEGFEPVPSKPGPARLIVDHAFLVAGTGTVVLAKVHAGKVQKYDRLKILPQDRYITVKSIQMNDVDVQEACAPARVGLLLKDIKSDEISRGDIITADDIPVQDTLQMDFAKCPFYKRDIIEGQGCLVGIGLQIKPARITSTDPFTISLEKPVVCDGGSTGIILRPESAGIRIMGSGTVI